MMNILLTVFKVVVWIVTTLKQFGYLMVKPFLPEPAKKDDKKKKK